MCEPGAGACGSDSVAASAQLGGAGGLGARAAGLSPGCLGMRCCALPEHRHGRAALVNPEHRLQGQPAVPVTQGLEGRGVGLPSLGAPGQRRFLQIRKAGSYQAAPAALHGERGWATRAAPRPLRPRVLLPAPPPQAQEPPGRLPRTGPCGITAAEGEAASALPLPTRPSPRPAAGGGRGRVSQRRAAEAGGAPGRGGPARPYKTPPGPPQPQPPPEPSPEPPCPPRPGEPSPGAPAPPARHGVGGGGEAGVGVEPVSGRGSCSLSVS